MVSERGEVKGIIRGWEGVWKQIGIELQATEGGRIQDMMGEKPNLRERCGKGGGV